MRIAHLLDDAQRILELRIRLAGEADDEVARQGDVRPRLPHSLDDAQIALGAVAAVHCLEDAVIARLHRQVEERHQLVDVAMRGDQAVAHVVGMAGGVADAAQVCDLRQFADQAIHALHPALVILAGPGVHILPQQRDLARAAVDQRLGFIDDRAPAPADFGAARVGDYAIGAEFVAALHDGEEGGGARLFRARGQRAELGGERHVGVDRRFAAPDLPDQVG